MTFMQIIDCHIDDYDKVMAMERDWRASTDGARTAQRRIVTRDHNDPTHYEIAVFFDDYESAMANSHLPETQRFAEQLGSLTSGPIVFHDLEVVEDIDLRTT